MSLCSGVFISSSSIYVGVVVNMGLSVQIFRDRGEVMISGIPTQWVAERIIRDINDILQKRGSDLVYFFEGSPGVYGGGLVIRVVLNTFLDENEVNALVKYFELRNSSVSVHG